MSKRRGAGASGERDSSREMHFVLKMVQTCWGRFLNYIFSKLPVECDDFSTKNILIFHLILILTSLNVGRNQRINQSILNFACYKLFNLLFVISSIK